MAEQEEIIGKVVEGTVTNVANFGAFVALSNGEQGLVHISEIANEYITDINAFVKIGDKLRVKVLTRNQKNKLELSIKKADPDAVKTEPVKPKEVLINKKSTNSNFEDKMTGFMKKMAPNGFAPANSVMRKIEF